MMRKGSITIFLALILSLIVSLMCAGIRSVRMAAARTQILNSVDIGLYSLFGQYDRTLLKEYDLFGIDASGGNSLDLASLYENLESYMKPVLKQNSQKLSLMQGGISGYRLMTDEEGEVFYQQIVRYMSDTLGNHGVQLLLSKMRERQTETRKSEHAGNEAESKNSLDTYETEMNAASQKSQEAEKAAEEQSNGTDDGFSADGQGGSGSGTQLAPVQVENPIPVIRQLRWMSIFDLVLQPGAEVSDKKIKKNILVSGRKLETGMQMDELKEDHSMLSQVLYQQYLMEKMGCYLKPGKGGLSYQIEYILQGHDSDEANLKAIARKLLLIREGVNAAHLTSDVSKRAQTSALAAAIAAGFLIPPAASVIEGALILCWAFAESILDVRELFDGGRVPLIKNSATWQLSLENLPRLWENLDSVRKSDENGLSYEDYLQIFLLSSGKNTKVMRGMDALEMSVKAMDGWEDFRLDLCVTALEADIDVLANKEKIFQVIRQYCYD